MEKKEALTRVFFETDKLYKSKERLRRASRETRRLSTLYRNGEKIYIQENTPPKTGEIRVTRETPLEVALRVAKEFPEQKITILNSGSATIPGSGVRRGTPGTEESLCRSTTLYKDISVPEYLRSFYQTNKNTLSLMYSDACIYSPDILIIRDTQPIPQLLPEQEWIKVDIITSCAPNLKAMAEKGMELPKDEELRKIHTYRAMKIMAVAAAHACDTLIVGAHGCSGYRNPPQVVAEAWKDAYKELHTYFDQIIFALGGSAKSQENYEVFSKIMP